MVTRIGGPAPDHRLAAVAEKNGDLVGGHGCGAEFAGRIWMWEKKMARLRNQIWRGESGGEEIARPWSRRGWSGTEQIGLSLDEEQEINGGVPKT